MVTIFLARLLEPKEFGLVAMVMVIIGLAQVFSDVGLTGALIQRRRVLPIHYSSVFYFNLTAGLALTLLTYFSAEWVGKFYANEALVPLAQVLSLSFLVNSFSSVQTARLRKRLENKLLVRCSLTASTVSGVIGIVLAFSGAGVWALVAQTLTHGGVNSIMLWTVARWVPGFQFSLKALMQLWGFGFHMFLAILSNEVFTRIDYLIIGKLFAPQTLGFFQRAKSLNRLVVHFSASSLMSVMFPMLSEIQNDLSRFRRVVLKSHGIICFVVFFLLGGLFVTSTELITTLFGTKWIPSVKFFEILVISGFGYPVSALLINLLASRGNSKAILRLEIYKKSMLGVNLVVLALYGIEVYLYGLIVTSVLGVSINIYFAAREVGLGVGSFFRPIAEQAFLAIISVSIVFVLAQFATSWGTVVLLAFKGSVFGLSYFLVNVAFKTGSFAYVSQELIAFATNQKRIIG